MFVIRDVFRTKPGRARELVAIFKQAFQHMQNQPSIKGTRLLTDVVADYWTVVMETETDDIGQFMANIRTATAAPEVREAMKNYMDCVESGHREIFMIE